MRFSSSSVFMVSPKYYLQRNWLLLTVPGSTTIPLTDYDWIVVIVEPSGVLLECCWACLSPWLSVSISLWLCRWCWWHQISSQLQQEVPPHSLTSHFAFEILPPRLQTLPTMSALPVRFPAYPNTKQRITGSVWFGVKYSPFFILHSHRFFWIIFVELHVTFIFKHRAKFACLVYGGLHQ